MEQRNDKTKKYNIAFTPHPGGLIGDFYAFFLTQGAENGSGTWDLGRGA
jgi:hypothetical protein